LSQNVRKKLVADCKNGFLQSNRCICEAGYLKNRFWDSRMQKAVQEEKNGCRKRKKQRKEKEQDRNVSCHVISSQSVFVGI
jgi:hypothetical protein